MDDITLKYAIRDRVEHDKTGAFAIAWAILQLAEQQERTADYLNDLGFSNRGAPGCLEMLAMKMGELASAAETIATELGDK